MNDYSNVKIYAIRSAQTDDIYIGSTIQPLLCKRMAGHRAAYKYHFSGIGEYVSSYKILQLGDAYIELLEKKFGDNILDAPAAIDANHIAFESPHGFQVINLVHKLLIKIIDYAIIICFKLKIDI